MIVIFTIMTPRGFNYYDAHYNFPKLTQVQQWHNHHILMLQYITNGEVLYSILFQYNNNVLL
jgi:hypothetical protein